MYGGGSSGEESSSTTLSRFVSAVAVRAMEDGTTYDCGSPEVGTVCFFAAFLAALLLETALELS